MAALLTWHFVQQHKQLFQWPSIADILWVNRWDMLYKAYTPATSEKSNRMAESDLDNLEKVFD